MSKAQTEKLTPEQEAAAKAAAEAEAAAKAEAEAKAQAEAEAAAKAAAKAEQEAKAKAEAEAAAAATKPNTYKVLDTLDRDGKRYENGDSVTIDDAAVAARLLELKVISE